MIPSKLLSEREGRRSVRALWAATLVAGLAVAAGPSVSSAGPGPGHFTSENVQWVSVNPRHTGSAGGRLVGNHFYVTDPRGVSIYDVSNPVSPTLTGYLPIFATGTFAALGQEDPDTNGKILLMNAVDPNAATNGDRLLVVNVQNKTAPSVIGSLAITDHTWTCVLDCTYAIGRSGNIVDLRNPAAPTKLSGDWRQKTKLTGYNHDLTEVRPGFVLTSGQPSGYIDIRDPENPVLLTKINSTFASLGYHSNMWPRGGTDDLMVMGTEIAPSGASNTAGSNCQGEGELATYDATAVAASDRYHEENPDEPRPAANFTKLGTWEIGGSGTYADGKAPFHVLYCAHWFDVHPQWNNGGLLAVAHYEWGTRFLRVDSAGAFQEVGWFQPVGGSTASAYWINEEVVYTLDYRRGLDILRFTGPGPAPDDGSAPFRLDPGDTAFWNGPFVPGGSTGTCAGDPCWDYPIDVTESGDRLRIGIDRPELPDVFTVEIYNPSDGREATISPGTGLYSAEFISSDPEVGQWRVRVIATDVVDSAFRMRAKLEAEPPELDPSPDGSVLPNLQVLPPHDASFLLPVTNGTVGNSTGLDTQATASCHPEEYAEDGAVRCLRFSYGVRNTGKGPMQMHFSGGIPNDHPLYQRVERADGSSYDRPAGVARYHKTHQHYHHHDVIQLRLYKVTDRQAGTSQPAGESRRKGFAHRNELIRDWHVFHPTWNTFGFGLTAGWADIYEWDRPGNYIDFGLNTDGYYVVRMTADPDNGVLESNEDDNYGYTYLRVTGKIVELLEAGRGIDPWDPCKIVVGAGGRPDPEPSQPRPADCPADTI